MMPLEILGLGTAVIFGFLTLLVLIVIIIEECNSSIKFWRLAWKKFRKWLKQNTKQEESE